jgi:peptidyl-prolyl cis-trans isomerase-like protein 2
LFALIQDKVGSWFSNPGAGGVASTSAGGGVGKYLTAQTSGSSDVSGNATSADDSSKKRKVKVLILVFKFPFKAHRM